MRSLLACAAVWFLVFASPAVAGELPQDENLLVPLPKDWVLGRGGRQGSLTMLEYVPANQTIEDWKQRITVQVLRGEGSVKPQKFLDEMARAAGERVIADGFSVAPLDAPADSEYPTAGAIWLSEKVKGTEKGEITMIRAIQGKDALYVLQKAWRQSPFKTAGQTGLSEEEVQEGMEFLWQARVVDTRR